MEFINPVVGTSSMQVPGKEHFIHVEMELQPEEPIISKTYWLKEKYKNMFNGKVDVWSECLHKNAYSPGWHNDEDARILFKVKAPCYLYWYDARIMWYDTYTCLYDAETNTLLEQVYMTGGPFYYFNTLLEPNKPYILFPQRYCTIAELIALAAFVREYLLLDNTTFKNYTQDKWQPIE